jgi:hypothetical protein
MFLAYHGVLERDNRAVVESARSMLLTSNLPREMWAEAVNCANYVLKRIPSKATRNKTPYMNIGSTANQISLILEFLDVMHIYMGLKKNVPSLNPRVSSVVLLVMQTRKRAFTCGIKFIVKLR